MSFCCVWDSSREWSECLLCVGNLRQVWWCECVLCVGQFLWVCGSEFVQFVGQFGAGLVE